MSYDELVDMLALQVANLSTYKSDVGATDRSVLEASPVARREAVRATGSSSTAGPVSAPVIASVPGSGPDQNGFSTPRDGHVMITGTGALTKDGTPYLGGLWTWDPEIRSNGQVSSDFQTVLPPTAVATMTVRLSF